MTELLWQTEVEVETVDERQQEETIVGPGALTVSLDDFSALEDRIRKAVDLVKNERRARGAAEERAGQEESRAVRAEERAASAEAQIQAQKSELDQQNQELSALRSERDQVRQRVERLLSQLDTLEL